MDSKIWSEEIKIKKKTQKIGIKRYEKVNN